MKLFAMILLFPSLAMTADIVVTTGGNSTTNGTNFQSAISSAALGDNIILTAGATYFKSGGFEFGDKGAGFSYITVRSDDVDGCPAEGERVNPPVHAPSMAKLIGSAAPVISINVLAHHWKFICLEVTNDGMNYSSALIYTANNGSATGGYATYSELYGTHHIIFDRLFVHNPEVTSGDLHPEALEIYAGRGIALYGVDLTVKNSWIGSFAGWIPGTGQTVLTDSYGIFGGAGSDILIENNRIEAFFNNIFWAASAINPDHTATISSPSGTTSATFSSVTDLAVDDLIAVEVPGGTDSCMTDANNPKCFQTVQVDSIAGLVVTYTPYGVGDLTVTPVNGGIAQWNGGQPTNVTTRLNYIWKNPWWQVEWSGGAKDYIEVKTCINCSYTANTFEGACAASIAFEVAQTGSNGGHPWDTIANNTFENNLLLGDVNAIFNPLDGAQASGDFRVSNVPGHDIIIRNNLWQNVPSACGSNPAGSGWIQTAAGYNVTVTHNTIRNQNTLNPAYNSGGDANGQTNLIIKDNIFNYGASGFNYNTPGGYTAAWPPAGIIEDGNIVIADGTLTNDPMQAGEVPNSFVVANDAAVGFTDVSAADAGGINDILGYQLAMGSTYKGMATDNTDPGVDFTALLNALGGIESSVASSPRVRARFR